MCFGSVFIIIVQFCVSELTKVEGQHQQWVKKKPVVKQDIFNDLIFAFTFFAYFNTIINLQKI